MFDDRTQSCTSADAAFSLLQADDIWKAKVGSKNIPKKVKFKTGDGRGLKITSIKENYD